MCEHEYVQLTPRPNDVRMCLLCGQIEWTIPADSVFIADVNPPSDVQFVWMIVSLSQAKQYLKNVATHRSKFSNDNKDIYDFFHIPHDDEVVSDFVVPLSPRKDAYEV